MYLIGLATQLILSVSVLLTPAPKGDHIIAKYELETPVKEFKFEQHNIPQRKAYWSAEDEEWVFDGSTLSRKDGGIFSSFTVNINPDFDSIDRRYVAASKIGEEGWLLFLPTFSSDSQPTSIRFPRELSYSTLHSGLEQADDENTITIDKTNDLIAYFGPSTNIQKGPVDIIHGPEVPKWVISEIKKAALETSNVLGKRLAENTPFKPRIIVSYNPIKSTDYRKGGALKGSTIAINFWSDMSKNSPDRLGRLKKFISHEMVHLWLNEIWNSSDENKHIWLHEGAAEYLAARIILNHLQFEEIAAAKLENCLSNLEGRPLDGSLGTIYGDVAYDCGFVVQLAAELSSMKRWRGDILDLWKDVLTSAPEKTYDNVRFLREAEKRGGETFAKLVKPMMELKGNPKIIPISNALTQLGIKVKSGHPGEAYGKILLSPAFLKILDSNCTGRRGWYSNSDHFELVTGNRCGPVLSGDPLISSIGGFSVIDKPFDAYIAIRQSCNTKQELELGLLDGGIQGSIICNIEIEEPSAFAIYEIPSLPDLNSSKKWVESIFR